MRKENRKWHNNLNQWLLTPFEPNVPSEILKKITDPLSRKVDICYDSQSLAYNFREFMGYPDVSPLI